MTHLRTLVRWGVAVVAVPHGLIHFLGATKSLNWGIVSGLKKPIGTAMGVVWFVAAVLMVATGALLAASVRRWWIVGAVAVVASQVAIVMSWSDAKVGTAANVLVLAAVVHGAAADGPTSFDAEYERRVSVALAPVGDDSVITEQDLVSLPESVAAYVRQSGAIGQPRVANFRATISGRIRANPTNPWMTFTGEQVNSFGPNPSRSFHMDATMAGLPVDVLHVYADAKAAMKVKLFALFPMVNATGPKMDRAETVTVFNDLVVLAPGAIVGAPIAWTCIDNRHVSGTYTNGTHTVAGELTFNEESKNWWTSARTIARRRQPMARHSPHSHGPLPSRPTGPCTATGSPQSAGDTGTLRPRSGSSRTSNSTSATSTTTSAHSCTRHPSSLRL